MRVAIIPIQSAAFASKLKPVFSQTSLYPFWYTRAGAPPPATKIKRRDLSASSQSVHIFINFPRNSVSGSSGTIIDPPTLKTFVVIVYSY